MKAKLCLSVAAAFCIAAPAHAIVITNDNDAAALAAAIAGSGVTISNPTLTFNTAQPSGTFTGGAGSVGFDSGIVLTTGTTACVPGPNNEHSCTGSGVSSSLKFDFTSTTGDVFFSYVFGSEEYTQFVGSQFNDRFELRLDGTNIALLPGGLGIVSINNVNCTTNSQFYRNNVDGEANQPAGCVNQHLDTELDGLTTVLAASATGLSAGTHTFEFFITDVGDSALDSAVFIQGGSFASTPPPTTLPEPGSLGLLTLTLGALAGFGKRKRT